ncbi:LLM class flavin-dependent oxidoreductase [Streptomyces sp. P6-2-1]|uniref:LLM class flavin-dependent oxidoreductase n=1 Tax=Streptomyces sp. P6-2-1 TaxID=3422591 RepID=UPI003D369533
MRHDGERGRGVPFGDPWMLRTAAALATARLRPGTLLVPVPRRRPRPRARQVATLDALSGGRVVLGAGLGGPVEGEAFGEPTNPRVLAGTLDEGLGPLARYWTGERVTHHGAHWTVEGAQLLPASVRRPRPPVRTGGLSPRDPDRAAELIAPYAEAGRRGGAGAGRGRGARRPARPVPRRVEAGPPAC